MNKTSKIYLAGHRGLVGSALHKELKHRGFKNIITRTHSELDLTDQKTVRAFFESERPEYVFLAAAKVGGIFANNSSPAEFIYQNLMIETNVIHAAYLTRVKRLLFLGSSCIYPKYAEQPIKESALLSGNLEPTNEAYAIAKIAGIKLCEAYNRQYGTDFRSVMPTNLYGPRDNFNLETSHVLPALMRKLHLAKLSSLGKWSEIKADLRRFGDISQELKDFLFQDKPEVVVWGTGRALREFLYVKDLAEACVYFMQIDQKDFWQVIPQELSHINIGTGFEVSISQLVKLLAEVIGFNGKIRYDSSKPDGTPRKILNCSRAADMGWLSRYPLRQGIQETYDWYCRQLLS